MNTSLSILIVEDEALYAELVAELVEELGHEVMNTLDNGAEVLAFCRENEPDLILMDIQIRGDYDGIELADALQERRQVPVIFITSQVDDATYARAKATRPYAFLEKTMRKRQLQRAIDLVSEKLEATAEPAETAPATGPEMLMVRTTKALKKLPVADILFIQAEDHYCTIFTAAEKFVSRISLKELMEQLPAAEFVQVHRSYVVRLDAIESISRGNMTIALRGREIPLGRTWKDGLLSRMKLI